MRYLICWPNTLTAKANSIKRVLAKMQQIKGVSFIFPIKVQESLISEINLTPFIMATVAGICNNEQLSKELRIMVRRYRKDNGFSFTIEEELSLCLIACASFSSHALWIEAVGEWITELAFEDFDKQNILNFESHIQYLLHAEPLLWSTCAKAEAAIRSASNLNLTN